MTVADQIKILDRKIKQNDAQYDFDRKAAKISTLSSNDLDKYEYLTGEDLDYQLDAVERARFEYSLLGKIFNKGLKEEDKKKEKGFLKILKNFEHKNEEQLKAIKYKTENIQEVADFVEELLSLEAKGLIEELKSYKKMLITGNYKLKAVTILLMILVIIKHLKNYLLLLLLLYLKLTKIQMLFK